MRYTNAVTLGVNGLLKKLPNTKLFEIRQPFFWFISYDIKRYVASVPRGFKTDFGSIPFFLRIFFNPNKFIGYILHDYLYRKVGKIRDTRKNKVISYTREKADNILLDTLRLEGANGFERFCIYSGVRLVGGLYYKKK